MILSSKIPCPACGGDLKRDVRPVVYGHNNQTITVDQPGLFCTQCDEAVLDPEDLATTRDPLLRLLIISERSGEQGYLGLDEALDKGPSDAE